MIKIGYGLIHASYYTAVRGISQELFYLQTKFLKNGYIKRKKIGYTIFYLYRALMPYNRRCISLAVA